MHGKKFHVVLDHKALIPLTNSKFLDQIDSPRLQKLVEKMGSYNFETSWRKGSDHKVADCLSRYPVEKPCHEDTMLNEELSFNVNMIQEVTAGESFLEPFITDSLIKKIEQQTQGDSVCQKLVKIIIDGFPEQKEHLDEELRPYWKVRGHLSFDCGLILYKKRIIIPQSMRRKTLADVHASHLGMERSMRRIRDTVYWPGIENQIKDVIQKCQICAEHAPSKNKQKDFIRSSSSYPFEMIHLDIFTLGNHDYFVAVDNYSSWIVMAWTLRAAPFTSKKIINQLTSWFATYGIPKKIVSDGGPQFASAEFKKMCDDWNIIHSMSSPYHPESNGKAESAVKCMKRLLVKSTKNGNINSEEFKAGLLEYRNTPNASGKSPAMALYGRPTRALTPHCFHFFKKQEKENDQFQTTSAACFPEFKDGDKVRVQDPLLKTWKDTGKIIGQHSNRNSFYIQLDRGPIIWRSIRLIKKNLSDSEGRADISKSEPIRKARGRNEVVIRERPKKRKRKLPAHLQDYICNIRSIIEGIKSASKKRREGEL